VLEIIRILDHQDTGKSVAEILEAYARLRNANAPERLPHEQDILSDELRAYGKQLAQHDKSYAVTENDR